MSTWDELRSDKALVCRREISNDVGGATVFMVLLSDGHLLDCGSGGFAEKRAGVLADLINEGGPERLSKLALSSPPTPHPQRG